jgi:hypothetical protein
MYDDLHKKMRVDNRRKQLARIGALEGNKIFVGGGGMDIKDGRDAPLPPPPDYKRDQGGGLTLGGGFTESDTGGRGHHGGPTQTPQSPSDARGTPFAQGGRIGYNRGRVVNPGGYAGDTDFTTWLEKQDIDIKTLNLDDLTSLQLEWDKIRPKHLDQADGGRVRFFYGGIATAL